MLTLHFTLPLKTPAKPKALALEVFDPAYLHRLQIRRQGPDQLVGAPAACPDEIPAAERRYRRARKSSTRTISPAATTRTTARCSPTRSRWSVRDPRTPGPGLARGPRDLRRRGGRDDARRPHSCGAGAERRSARRSRPPPRRRSAASSADIGKAIGILPRDVRDHPRRQVRRPRRSGPCSGSPLPTASFTPPAPAMARR